MTPASGGDALENLPVASFVSLQGFGIRGAEVARSDGVDLNAFGSPLVGESFGELGDAAFAGCIGGNADASLKAEERCDVDDFAAAAGNHVTSGELRKLKGAGEIDLEDAIPIFESDVFGGGAVDGAGVVDEDVDATECGDDLVEEMLGSTGIREISLEGMGDAACGRDSGSCVVGWAAVAVASYGGSGLRESSGDSGTETAG